jgi:hypothetical protein
MARSVHILVRLLAGFSALFVVVLALLAARLSTGPVSLAPVMPVIENALGAQTSYRFRIGDGDLLWLDWRRGLRIHLSNVELSGENAAARGQIQSVAIAFSAEAMAHGALAPSSVEVNSADLIVNQGIQGLRPGSPSPVAGAEGESLTDLLAGLRSPPDPHRPLSYLYKARIKDVVVDVEDPGADGLRMRIDDARFLRDDAAALKGEASIVLSQGGQDAAISIDLGSESADSPVDGEVVFSNFKPAAFAGLVPDLAPLAAIDALLTGKLTLDLAPDGTPGEVELAVSGSAGALVLTKPLLEAAGLASPEQRLPLRSLALQASLAPAASQITVRSAELVFAPGTIVYVPPPVDHRLPLSLVSGHGSLANGRLSVPTLDIDLGGLQLTASAAVDNMSAGPSGTGLVSARNVKVDDFRRYWPPKAAPGAYRWCTEHLRDGIVPRVRARLAFASHDGGTEVTSLGADFGVERLTVDHLPPMPPVRDARGTVKIDLKTMTINITGGRSAGLTVTGGTVVIPDLERDVPSIDIDVSVAGPVRNAMNMIASEPLTYPQKIGLSPEQTSGEMTARLRLGFPLLAALKLEEMDVRAAVDLTNAGIADLAKGVGVSNAQVHLDIDTAGMHAAGRLAVANVEGALDLAYSFTKDADPQTRMEFVTNDVALSRLRQSFPDFAKLDGYLLDGSFDAGVRATVAASGQANIQARLDLAKTEMTVPYLRWRKGAGPPASLDIVLQTHGDRLTDVPRMSFSGPDMEVRGSLRLHPDGGLERLDIDSLISGRNDGSATIVKTAEGRWDITVNGESIDLETWISRDGEGLRENGSTFASFPDLAFAADVNAVWLGGPQPIGDVMATLVHDGGLWTLAKMQGRLSDGSIVELSVTPTDGQGRTFRMTAGNAGEALRAFEIFPDMIGGRMSTEGWFDDSDPAHPLRAKLRVKSYHIVNTPILARLLGLLSLGGIRDALTGKGIHFSTLDMPFKACKGVIAIDNGKAFGSALGLTFSGAVDTNVESLDIQGQVVPFYAVNSVIGHVPLIGDIMTGGEEGGGIFSASYWVAGPLGDPQVSVNPVTVLFPGFLRWILDTFEGWVSPEAPDGNGNMLP